MSISLLLLSEESNGAPPTGSMEPPQGWWWDLKTCRRVFGTLSIEEASLCPLPLESGPAVVALITRVEQEGHSVTSSV